MNRQCARPSCSAAASATLSYDYRQRITWLEPLAGEPHPMAYDLCDAHADALTVPQGWRLEDRREEDTGVLTADDAYDTYDSYDAPYEPPYDPAFAPY